jgi:hypothetical protein
MCVLQGGMQDGLSQAPQPWQVNFPPGPRPLSFHWRHAPKYPAHTNSRSRVQCVHASSGRRRRPDQVGAGLAPSHRVGESTTGAVTRRRRQATRRGSTMARGSGSVCLCLLKPSRGRIEAVSCFNGRDTLSLIHSAICRGMASEDRFRHRDSAHCPGDATGSSHWRLPAIF